MNTDSKGNHVLVLGCGRSGTSIFGEFFHDIITFDYYSEPFMTDIMQMDLVRPVAIKVPRSDQSFPPYKGLSFPIEAIKEKFGDQLVIFWIVRHPLDAICSLRVGISKNWGHHPRPENWEEWLDRPLLERCAFHWNYINSYGYEQIKDYANLVFFEDMVSHPANFAEHVLEHVQKEDIEDSKIDYWISRVQNSNNSKFIEAETSREYSRNDHTKRVGRWQENLSKEEVERIWPIVSETASKFGYEK